MNEWDFCAELQHKSYACINLQWAYLLDYAYVDISLLHQMVLFI